MALEAAALEAAALEAAALEAAALEAAALEAACCPPPPVTTRASIGSRDGSGRTVHQGIAIPPSRHQAILQLALLAQRLG